MVWRSILASYAFGALRLGLPGLGPCSLRASTEARETMRLVPSLHESSSPAPMSWDTLAELTPSSRAASAAVMAGMSPSSRSTATAMTLPPCSGPWPKPMGGSSVPFMRWSSTIAARKSAALATASSRSSPNGALSRPALRWG